MPISANVRFHRLAAEEYLEARRWYERRRSGLGEAFAVEVDRATRRIAEHPDRWPLIRGNYRRVRLRRFPYLLVYEHVGSDDVIVFAVAHTKRRPTYWIRRVSRG